MQHKRLLLGLTIANVAILATALIFTNSQTNPLIRAGANTQSYKMEFSKDKNKFTENSGNTAFNGTAYPLTNLGNKKQFDYYQLKGVATSWQVLGNGGYFYNVDPINGIQSISMTFGTTEKSYKVLYSRDTSFDQVKEFTTSSESESSMVYGFDGYLPNYFKVLNTSGSNLIIKSLTVDFSCVNNYPSLTLINDNEEMGTISGPSYMTAGTKTTITATPNTDYKFVGWYFGNKLISEKSTYTFTAGNEDLTYTARFTYVSYNLVIQSEDNEKGKVSESTGTYNYLTPITIEAKANEGYTFDGWYNGSTLVSKDNPYTFNMPYSDTTYVAKFSTNSYEVVLNNANSDLGSITGSGSFLYKSSVTLTASPNTGVCFLGWYDSNDELKNSEFKPLYKSIF